MLMPLIPLERGAARDRRKLRHTRVRHVAVSAVGVSGPQRAGGDTRHEPKPRSVRDFTTSVVLDSTLATAQRVRVHPTDLPFTCTVPSRGKQPIREDRLRTRRFSAGPLGGTVSGATASWVAPTRSTALPPSRPRGSSRPYRQR